MAPLVVSTNFLVFFVKVFVFQHDFEFKFRFTDNARQNRFVEDVLLSHAANFQLILMQFIDNTILEARLKIFSLNLYTTMHDDTKKETNEEPFKSYPV